MDEGIKRTTQGANWRVKVYLLNEGGDWDDCGAGHLEIAKEVRGDEEIDFLRVIHTDEPAKVSSIDLTFERLKKLKGGSDNERYVLNLPIRKYNQFEKQGESIIAWNDRDIEEEVAISFLDSAVVKETWRVICAKTGRNPDMKDQFKDLDKLIIPTIKNLEQVRTELETRKNWMIYAIKDNNAFLQNLFQVFRDCEDLEILDSLHIIHDIIRLLIFSEDVPLLELLLSDEYYLLVFGALECNVGVNQFANFPLDDPGVKVSPRPKYREFLENKASYKKVLDFQDETILKKIRLNYRISYLKDTVISSIIDDPLSSQFNAISYYTSHAIYEHIMNTDEYLDIIFGKLTTQISDAVGFLYELLQIVKSIVQVDEKTEFCRKLVNKNIFETIAKALNNLYSEEYQEEIEEERKNIIKINLIDILFYLLQFELNAFITFLHSGVEAKMMIEGIINSFFYGDQGLQIQTAELIKYLIDTLHEKKNEILDIFYDSFIPAFVEHYKTLENNEKFYSFVQQFIEILAHCLKSHGYRIRHYIIHHKLLHKLYPGFQAKEKSIHLALIRLLKNIALSQDDFLLKYVVHNHLLDDIFELYVKNAFKSNLLNSACLELFGLFSKENIKKLIIEFVERFKERVQELGLERHFEKMFIKYEQITEDTNKTTMQEEVELPNGVKLPVSNSATGAEKFGNYTRMERESLEDEEYFENEDDEEDPNKANAEAKSEVANGSNSPKSDSGSASPASSALSDEQIKSNMDSLQRLKNKIASKKKESDDDTGFFFGNKTKKVSAPSTPERSPGPINIQFSFSTDSNNVKRAGIDLTSDEELNDAGQIDPQKKIKS